jgi:hypothetical protein
MKTYFSDETYKLTNLNHHKLLAMDRSIAGHDLFRYCEQFKTYRERSFFFYSQIKWTKNKLEMAVATIEEYAYHPALGCLLRI